MQKNFAVMPSPLQCGKYSRENFKVGKHKVRFILRAQCVKCSHFSLKPLQSQRLNPNALLKVSSLPAGGGTCCPLGGYATGGGAACCSGTTVPVAAGGGTF